MVSFTHASHTKKAHAGSLLEDNVVCVIVSQRKMKLNGTKLRGVRALNMRECGCVACVKQEEERGEHARLDLKASTERVTSELHDVSRE